MSFFTKLGTENKNSSSLSPAGRGDVQPMLLREDETPSWVFNGSAWCVIILSISIGMIAFGFLISEKKTTLPHHLHTVVLQKKTPPLIMQKSVQQNNSAINIKNASASSISHDANQFYQDAVALIKKGQVQNAIIDLTKAIGINSQFQKAREALAVLFIQTDNVSSALSVLNKGLDLSPDYYPFTKLKAQIFVNEGLYDDALHLLTDNLPQIEQHPGYYALLAAVYNKEKKYLVAADIYRQLTQLNPGVGQWWFGLGASLNLAGKNDEAKTAYQKALQVGGIKPEVRVYLESQLGS